jgi:energy-coupling factor transporter ATP-binding protein EcfA2
LRKHTELKITIPELSLVVLLGPSDSGKSTFARTHSKPTEVISSDFCRGLFADNENDQTAAREAFEILYFIARKRLPAGRLTVVDATNVQPERAIREIRGPARPAISGDRFQCPREDLPRTEPYAPGSLDRKDELP